MYTVNKIELNLTVPSLEETFAWYERVLGWSGHCDVRDAQGRCGFGSVIWGEMISHPKGNDPPMRGFNLVRYGGEAETYRREHPHLTAFIKVDDVDAVYRRVRSSGAETDGSPRDQPWGGRLFSLVDLNGFHLTLYQIVGRAPTPEQEPQ
jgi:predicted enzyme related to lactoylglutathione lyase